MFFVFGILFGFMFVLPASVRFLLAAGIGIMKPVISGSSYISFCVLMLFTVGIIFELPFIMVMLYRLGIVKSGTLREKRKMAIIVVLIILAVLTPTPDAFTLLAISLPVILLYEVSIWWIFIMEKKSFRKNG